MHSGSKKIKRPKSEKCISLASNFILQTSYLTLKLSRQIAFYLDEQNHSSDRLITFKIIFFQPRFVRWFRDN